MHLSNYDWSLSISEAQMKVVVKALKGAVEEYKDDPEFSELEEYEYEIATKFAKTLEEQHRRKRSQRNARMKRKTLYRENRENQESDENIDSYDHADSREESYSHEG